MPELSRSYLDVLVPTPPQTPTLPRLAVTTTPFVKKQRHLMRRLRHLKLLAEGNKTTIHLVEDENTGNKFAVKTFDMIELSMERSKGTRAVDIIGAEVRMLLRVRSPFILTMHSAWVSDHEVHLILEYCCGGDLYTRIARGGPFPEPVVQLYMAEILLGVQLLHSNGILHADIKPENVLIDADGHIKLADFGMAVDMSDMSPSVCRGTADYQSPEQVCNRGFSFPADMWAIGCMLHELSSGNHPFMCPGMTRSMMFRRICVGTIRRSDKMGDHLWDLLQGLLHVDVEQRLTVEEAIAHQFFTGMDWNLVRERATSPLWKPPVNGEPVDAQFVGKAAKPLMSDSENFTDCIKFLQTVDNVPFSLEDQFLRPRKRKRSCDFF